MKKRLAIPLLVIAAAGCIVGAAACGAHTHSFAQEWSKDEAYHWHKATCTHVDAEEKQAHSFGEWSITTPATETQEGTQTRTCGVCGYVCAETIPMQEHKHVFAEEWTSDETNHWHVSTCGHDETSGLGAHVYSAGKCIKCDRPDPAASFTFEEMKEGEEVIGYAIAVKSEATAHAELAIPSTHLGKPVLKIAEQGLQGIAAKTVNIPSGIKTIGDYAFWKSAVEEIIIPDSVESLGAAFYECEHLKTVTIGNGVQQIANYTFYSTPALQTVIFGNGVKTMGQQVFQDSAIQELVIPDSVETLGSYFCYKADKLVSVTLGKGLREIPGSAFESCTSLKSVQFGENVTKIGSAAFKYCALEEISLEGKIQTVGNQAFNYNAELRSVTFGESVTSIDSAFLEDYRLIEICNKSTVNITKGQGIAINAQNVCSAESEKGQFATTDDGFLYYSFQDGGTQKTYLLGYYGNQTALTLPAPSAFQAQSYVINTGAFDGQTQITSVIIPAGVTEVMGLAFYECTALQSVSIGNDVTTIGTRAFKKCGLTTLTIPENVATVKMFAFAECTSLKRVEWNAVNCAGFTYEEAKSSGNGIFSEGSATAARAGIETLVFGNGVKTIPAYMFRSLTGVTNVTIPASVTKIEDMAFYKSGLTSVTFAVQTGWKVTGSVWGEGVVKTPNFSNQSEILSWLSGTFASVWTR